MIFTNKKIKLSTIAILAFRLHGGLLLHELDGVALVLVTVVFSPFHPVRCLQVHVDDVVLDFGKHLRR